jgi:uncharacterized protein with beta-barrel porin domain
MRAGARRGGFLLSSSAAALLIGAGAPPALAACGNTIGASFDNPAAHTTPCIAVTNTSFTGTITNEGTIAPGGIIFNNGTVTGFIASSGTIVGGIALDLKSAITNSSGNAIQISGPTFLGGIRNSGTISGPFGAGILVGANVGSGGLLTISTFAGGITNSGMITAGAAGVLLGGAAFGSGSAITIANFSGGISNSGTISASGPAFLMSSGIIVGGSAVAGGAITISTFMGGISNSGTISVSPSKGTPRNGIVVGGAAPSAASIAVSTFAGGISNSGTISVAAGKAAANGILVGNAGGFFSGGTVTISAFSGGISNSGTISVSGGGKGGTSTGIVVGNAGFVFSGTAVAVSTFMGGITNSGTIRAGGVGILVGAAGTSGAAAAISTFAGGIINTGAITAGGAAIVVANVATFMGGITNAGTLSAASGTGIAVVGVSKFVGNISNSGTILAGNTGIFVCNCVSLAGGSIINTGTISAATGLVVHNFSSVSIFDSGTIVGTGGTAVDLTAASGGNTFTLGPGYSITGNVLGFLAGGDTFQLGGTGSGTFDLSSVGASAQYQNFTTFNVVGGTWSVFNTFGQTQPWNVNGGTLAGTGTLPAVNVNPGATLEPGTIGVPGTTMTITGHLAFAPGSFYLVNIGPTTASRVDVVSAGGTAALNGAVQGFLAPGSYSTKTTYVILDPAVITGTFTGYSSINAPGFGGTLSYTPTEVLLNLTAALGAGGGLGSNQQNVANTINNFFNNGGTLPAGFFPLFGLTGGQLSRTLAQLSGEAATGSQLVSDQMMTEFLTLMLDPTLDGRGGAGAMPFAADRDSILSPELQLAYARALKQPELVLKAAPPPTLRWSAWASAFGGYNQTNGDAATGSSNVIARDGGVAAGVDYHYSRDTVLGLALAAGDTNWGLAHGVGGGRSNAFEAGLYGRSYWGPAYVAGALAVADHAFTTNRFALGDQLQGNFNGLAYAGRLEAGNRYAVPFGAALLGITPYAALQAQWFHTDPYLEADLSGGGLGLNVGAMSGSDTRSELGARFDDLMAFNGMPLMLRGRLAWAHDWVSGPALAAVFQGLPGAAFTVNGATPAPDSALTTAGAELHLTPNWTLSAKFEGEFAPRAQTYAGTGTVRYRW